MADVRGTKRRLPSGSACDSCRKKKNRCDGERPRCSCCRSRGISCDYSTVLASQLSVEELKEFMMAKLHSQCDGDRSRAARRGADERHQESFPSPGSNSETVSLGTIGEVPSNFVHGSREGILAENTCSPAHRRAVMSEAIDEEDGGCDSVVGLPSPESYQPEGYFGESSTFSFVSNGFPERSSKSEQQRSPERRRLSTLSNQRFHHIREDVAALSEQRESWIDLPERNVADRLLDAYFDRVRPLYPFLHEPSFRAEYERAWLLPRHSRTELRPEWLGMLNLIFASGCEFCNAIVGEDELPRASEFVARSRGLILSRIFRSGNLEMVQALLLLSHYLQGTLELEECWNLVGLMIRTAVGIGLHLNHSNKDTTAIEIEARKRAWWGCVVIDRTLSMKFGRPLSIRATNIFAVDFPLNVDDQYITNKTLIPRQPEGRPSLINFYSQTIKMSAIIASVLIDLYQPDCKNEANHKRTQSISQDSDISRILGCTVRIDGELLLWWDDIPSHLKQEPEVADGVDFQRQRQVLLIRFLNLRLLLHRQAFLIYIRREIEDSFQRAVAVASARSCIGSACETIRLISAHYDEGLLNSLAYNLHYVFTAMGVLLTLQIMNKTKLDAVGKDNQRETLDSGMEFLKKASNKSALAARYILMLQRLQSRDSAVPNNLETPSGFRAGDLSEPSFMFTEELTWPAPVQDDVEGSSFQTAADFDSVYCDDFLRGTGLPRDFVSGQWLNTETYF